MTAMGRWEAWDGPVAGSVTSPGRRPFASIQAEYETLRLRRAIVGQLRALREQRNWTQQQLAEAVGVPRSAISRLESAGHSPRLETLHAVARVLGYDVDVRLKRRQTPVA